MIFRYKDGVLQEYSMAAYPTLPPTFRRYPRHLEVNPLCPPITERAQEIAPHVIVPDDFVLKKLVGKTRTVYFYDQV